MLNLQQLKTFVVCAEVGSFSAAARKLGKAQSVVSQTIANLEVDLGLALFDRSTRKPTLTTQGVTLLAHAQATIIQTQELESAAMALSAGDESELTLVVDPALLLPKLYQILQDFCNHYPATNLTLNIANSDDIAGIVEAQDAQFGLKLIDDLMPTGVELGLVGHLPFFVVVHPDHPLSQLPSISRAELAKYTQLLVRSAEKKAVYLLPEISPQKFWSNDFEAIKSMAENSLGWCYLPAHIAQPSIDNASLIRLPVNFDIKTWTIPVDRVMAIDTAKSSALMWLAKAAESLFDN